MNLDLFAVTVQRDRQSAHPTATNSAAASPAPSRRAEANTLNDQDNHRHAK
jgi:hypothetical protein